ncbi:hypothetical protein KSP39_PZI017453 [Platanthera zijinensis]|uniref:NADH-plastoquinone oxidoreductase subunit 1 n=1 Tax=Platanthera zijinensis TaxID=2320716 RepID=A0AAP0B4D0_9ASPA
MSSLAECERLPFDLPEAEEELVAGYKTEYSGIKYGFFYLASYLNLLVSSLFVTILYLGGWNFSISYCLKSSKLVCIACVSKYKERIHIYRKKKREDNPIQDVGLKEERR